MKKTALLLLAFLVFALCSINAFAYPDDSTSGVTGTCYWELNGSHLTIKPITASGNIGDYAISDDAPWKNTAKTVTVEYGVLSIGTYAFAWCDLTSISLPDTVTEIDQSAFMGSELESVYIPSSVTYIGRGAFGYCDKLTGITVASNNLYYSSADGALFDKYKTTLIHFPASKYVTSYTAPSTVKNIAYLAFAESKSLERVSLPYGLEKIDSYAFYDCKYLESIRIPSSVSTISNSTFNFCSSLESIYIPESVTYIEEAFANCTSLSTVYYEGTASEWNEISISNADNGNDCLLNASVEYNQAFEIYTPESENAVGNVVSKENDVYDEEYGYDPAPEMNTGFNFSTTLLVIVGVIFGGFLLTIIAVVIIVVCVKKSKKKKEEEIPVTPIAPAVAPAATTPCPKCAYPMPAGSKFCRNCGSNMNENIPKMRFCSGCGKKYDGNETFCSDCGSKIY